VPIAYGLAYPHRVESGASRVDFRQVGSLTFEEPDSRRFPGLALAWQALRGPQGSTVVLNAANEVAVEAFLDRRLAFTDIHTVNTATLDATAAELGPVSDIESLIDLDARARAQAQVQVARLCR
jgi:1-deoxy-D-xylulose-5-phosphate reductoisomerase